MVAGYRIRDAAQIANLDYTNAHKWVKRSQSAGLEGLQEWKRPGRPRIHGGEIEDVVVKIAISRPLDLGLVFTTWSLPKIKHHLRQHSGISPISCETIRHILSRHGLPFLTGQTCCESKDTEFEVKKRYN